MRLIVYIFLLLLIPITLSAQQIKYPHSPFHIQAIYQLEDGNKIYIEQYEHGDIIWQQDSKTGKFIKLAFKTLKDCLDSGGRLPKRK